MRVKKESGKVYIRWRIINEFLVPPVYDCGYFLSQVLVDVAVMGE